MRIPILAIALAVAIPTDAAVAQTNRVKALVGGTLIEYRRGREGAVRTYFNLSPEKEPLTTPPPADGETILFSSESPRYGGRHGGERLKYLLPFECLVLGRDVGNL